MERSDLNKITLPTITTQPTKGTVLVNPDGTIKYTSTPGQTGTDTFVYSICDKINTTVCDTAKVTVNISPGPNVQLQVKVFLQGAFFPDTTSVLMRDDFAH